ncbi:hypothetical protein [Streptomyces sp. enrichment culture]|uniref:hypothetical protein n=1 Tax=Streptomyces sp. enrichment culture TaxID=1795815 RepID=UPI003F5775F4
MSFGPQPRYGSPPYPDAPAADARPPSPEEAGPAGPGAEASGPVGESGALGVGLRAGGRVAAVWLVFVLAGAVLPDLYGVRVAGALSLGVVLGVVPFAVGVHALVVYGRRVDAAERRPGARRWS